MKRGEYEGSELPNDDFPGRFFACWEPEPLAEVVDGAGLRGRPSRTVDDGWIAPARPPRPARCPTTSAPDLRVLVCGLNPSLYAADAGRRVTPGPGNRFWPAALAAGLVTHDRDPLAAPCATTAWA